MGRMVQLLGVALLLTLICGASEIVTGSEARTLKHWEFVELYAPVVMFNRDLVRYRPTNLLAPDQGEVRCYVNVFEAEPYYTFQYWFYYTRDVRIPWPLTEPGEDWLRDQIYKNWPAAPTEARVLHDWADQYLHYIDLERKALHEHDWELLEVVVSDLGSVPEYVCYYAHGESRLWTVNEVIQQENAPWIHWLYTSPPEPEIEAALCRKKDPIQEQYEPRPQRSVSDFRVRALVATDQHGTYPLYLDTHGESRKYHWLRYRAWGSGKECSDSSRAVIA